jgi:hypothetical protein
MNHRNRYIIAVGFFLLSLGGPNIFAATSELIEEAEGLAEETLTTELTPDPASSALNPHRTRAYVLIDGAHSVGSSDDQIYFPNAQLSFSGDFQLKTQNFFLLDMVGNYDNKKREFDSFLNQVGFRSRLSDEFQYFIGKERNRRSPGLIVSPSDFIHSTTNLPGQREDRKGVWLARVSYQKINHSFDVIALPVQYETSDGSPESRQNSADLAVRGLKQFSNVDLSFMAGRYLGIRRAGMSAQSLLENKYKFYLELGTQEESKLYNNTTKSNPAQALLGAGYEGSEDFAARLEYYENGQGLSSEEFSQMMRTFALFPAMAASRTGSQNPFLRQKYLIASLSMPEIQDRYNLTFSAIKSLEDDSSLGIFRFEYIASDKLLLGVGQSQVQGEKGSQYQYRNYDRQTTVDLKYSF